MAVDTRGPTSDEAVSGTWTGTAGSRYTLVDDFPDTGAADSLVVSTASGGNLTFGFTAFSIASDKIITKVEVCYRNYKGGTNANAIGGRLKIGGTYYNATTHSPPNGLANMVLHQDTWTTNPATGSAWTPAQVNAIQAFGWTCTDGAPAITLPDIQLEVTYSDIGGTTSSTLSPATVFATGFAVSTGGTATANPTGDRTAQSNGTWSNSPQYSQVNDYPDSGGSTITSSTNASLQSSYIEFSMSSLGLPPGAVASSLQVLSYCRSTISSSSVYFYTAHNDGEYRYGTTTIASANTWTLLSPGISTTSPTALTVDEINGTSGTKRIVGLGVWNYAASGVTLDIASLRLSCTYTVPVVQGFLPITTLGAATISAEGEVDAGVDGTLAVTIGAATATTTATVLVSGSAAITTSAATAAGTATVLVSGTLGVTASAATIAATGTVAWPGVTGTLASTLGAASITATGTVLVGCSLSATTSAVTASSTATLLVSGVLDTTTVDTLETEGGDPLQAEDGENLEISVGTLGEATLSAAGTVSWYEITAALDSTLGAVSVESSSVVASIGTLNTTTDAVVATSTGAVSVSGQLAVTLDPIAATITGIGETDNIEGFTTATLGSAAIAATGAVLVSGTLSTALSDATAAASASIAVSGTFGVTTAATTVAASGTVANTVFSGSLDSTLATATLAATGTLAISGSLAVTLQAAFFGVGGAVGSVPPESLNQDVHYLVMPQKTIEISANKTASYTVSKRPYSLVCNNSST